MFRRIAVTASAAALALVMGVACSNESTEATATTDTAVVGMESTDTSATVPGTTLQESDVIFITDAAIGGLAEVEFGKLAVEKATNPEVRQFGQMMLDNHGAANTELQTLAQQKGIQQLPTALNEEKTEIQNRLAALSGAEFDREYMKEMVKDHKEDVEEFQKASNEVADSDVKAFASKTLPTLQQHLQQAEQVASKVGAN